MNKKFLAALLCAAAAFTTASAMADEGDYVVILKEAPAVMLLDDSVINHVDNVFVVDSLMAAYSIAPYDNIEAIFPDEKAYLFDEEEGEFMADAPVVEPYPEGADDPYYADQWHLPQINVSSAWRNGFIGNNVRVAIIDSGMDLSHPDLPKPTLYYNAMSGADTSDVSDELGHGTAVTGLIAAKTNNSRYTSGIAHGVQIVPIKVASASQLYTSAMLLGFAKALEYNCDIINMSLGFTRENAPQTAASMGDIVAKAINDGVIIVAAAGNDGEKSTGGYYQYPASYDNVISVGSLGDYANHTDVDMAFTRLSVPVRSSNGEYSYSTIFSDVPSSFTQHNDKVTCAAPGYRILSTGVNSTTARKSGTSFSSPIVAAVAAVAKQAVPGLTAPKLIEAIKATSKDVFTAGYDIYTGYGEIDVDALLTYLTASAPEPTATPQASETPEATATPEPTATPESTSEPTATPTATPVPDGIYRNGTSYTIHTSYEELTSGAKVLAAIYSDGKLRAVESTAVSSGSTNTKIYFTYNGEIDYADVFIWEHSQSGELTLLPLAEKMCMKCVN